MSSIQNKILELFKTGAKQKDIAKRLKVSDATVSNIIAEMRNQNVLPSKYGTYDDLRKTVSADELNSLTAKAAEYYMAGYSYRAIAQSLFISRDQAHGLILRARTAKKILEEDTPEIANTQDQMITEQYDRSEKAKRRLQDNLAAQRSVNRQSWRLENAMDALMEHAQKHAFPAPQPYKIVKPTGKQRISVFFHLTDWHAFEIVQGRMVNNLNAYNGDIFSDRVQSAVDQGLGILSSQYSNFQIDEIVTGFGGDMSSGLIHGLDRYIEGDPITVTLNVGATMALAYTDLATYAKSVGAKDAGLGVTGNHGRLRWDTSGQNTNAIRESFDYVSLAQAKALLANVTQKFRLPESMFEVFRLQGRNYILAHGDLLSGKGSGTHERALNTLKELAFTLGIELSGIFIGHIHTPITFADRVYVTGSPKGRDGYAHGKALGDTQPSQCMYVVDEKGAVTQHILYCDRPLTTPPRYRTRWTDTGLNEEKPGLFILEA